MASMSVDAPPTTTEPVAVAPTDEDVEAAKRNPHKHDSGAADLEKVTDFVEERELAVDRANVNSLLGPKTAAPVAVPTRIVIRKEDVELIVRELEVPKVVAEKKLRECRGNVVEAVRSLMRF